MPIPESLQLNQQQCVLFMNQVDNNAQDIINPKTGRKIKNTQTINKIKNWCIQHQPTTATSNIQAPIKQVNIEKFENKLKEKITKIRNKIQNEKNKMFVSEDHKQICEDAKFVMKELERYEELRNKRINLRIDNKHFIPLDVYKTMISNDYINKLTIPYSNDYIQKLKIWLIKSDEFVKSLSQDEKDAIYLYTLNNYKLVTTYMTSKKTAVQLKTYLPKNIKLFSNKTAFFRQIMNVLNKKYNLKDTTKNIKDIRDSKLNHIINTKQFTKEVVYEYLNFMISIFKKAPKIESDTYLYRGTTSDFYLKGSKNSTYKNPTMASFSVIPEISFNFMNKSNKCCMQIAKILKGMPCIYIGNLSHYKEYEVILPPNFTYLIKSARSKNYFIDKNGKSCFTSYIPITTSELTVIGHDFSEIK